MDVNGRFSNPPNTRKAFRWYRLDETYLVYACGESDFQSRLAFGKDKALETCILYVFGKSPDPEEDEEGFDLLTEMLHDFKNDNLWIEKGNLWEWEWEKGFLTIVTVQSLLN